MYKFERTISLQWTLHRSMFAQANKNVMNVGSDVRRVGSALSAVNEMLSKGEEMKVLMPTLLGADPSSNKLDWEVAIKNYWHSFEVDIPFGGRILDIGWDFDLNSPDKVAAINALDKKVKSDKDLADYAFSKNGNDNNIREEYLFRYGTPSNVEDYLLWRYCLVYRRVLNPGVDPSILDRNPDIEFYLYDASTVKETAKTTLKLVNQASEIYLGLLTKSTEKDNMLFVFGENPIEMEDYDKDFKLKEYSNSQPERFIAFSKDKNLNVKAKIERYVSVGILRRLPNTSIIVDADDASLVLGNSINEVVSFFNNPVNATAISEYGTKYKVLEAQNQTQK